MPNRPKGPRLYLRRGQPHRDGSERQSVWLIRDGRYQESTGCTDGDVVGAERALEAYLNRKHSASVTTGSRRPDQIPVADVLALYLADKVPGQADPIETKRRIKMLSGFFGSDMLSDISGARCRAYVAHRSGKAIARRELEDLRAAINHHREEGLCSEVVGVSLPEKSAPRDMFLSRQEAARAIWMAWRHREKQNYRATDRKTRQHIARLILVGIYTGTRPGTILAAALQQELGRPWCDLDRGVFHRRPAGLRETKKRRPPIPIPERLLAHLRRWKRLGQRYVIEFNGRPVSEVRHAFEGVMKDAGLMGVTPHILRHTAVTWAMLDGADLYQAGRFFGLTAETLDRVYAHHRPDHLAGMKRVMNTAGRTQAAHTLGGTDQETTAAIPRGKTRKTASG